ncbi:MAG: hypothetical protein EBR73_17460, partial [Rhodobacteraceae bacterium]|nr:hypothetical protein [Paracoccaceae bacterium]
VLRGPPDGGGLAGMTWIATVGITWDGGRAEPGEAVPDAVVEAAPWLVEQGHVMKQEHADG